MAKTPPQRSSAPCHLRVIYRQVRPRAQTSISIGPITRIEPWILSSARAGPQTHLRNHQPLAALRVIHRQVQPRAEHVLVVLPVHAGPHERAVPRRGALAGAQLVGAQLARQLDLVLNAAILWDNKNTSERVETDGAWILGKSQR